MSSKNNTRTLPVLSSMLGQVFKGGKKKKTRSKDIYRKPREKAKALAAEHGIEIEKLTDGGMNVWAPDSLPENLDPFAGDHFANDWSEACSMVEAYAALCVENAGAKEGNAPA